MIQFQYFYCNGTFTFLMHADAVRSPMLKLFGDPQICTAAHSAAVHTCVHLKGRISVKGRRLATAATCTEEH